MVDNFGVKYVGKQHADLLLRVLHKHYKTTIDWTGGLYCGITLAWNYDERYLDISIPGYIDKVRKRFKHILPNRPQHSPYQPQPKKYGTVSQDPIDPDLTDPIGDTRKTKTQQLVGMVLYYARAIDLALLPGLSGLASEQAAATEATEHGQFNCSTTLALIPMLSNEIMRPT